jgi:hypothetical protein
MFIHCDNIAQKLLDKLKYNDDESIAFLNKIKEKYEVWKATNLALIGPS